jgi:hypothetical protein
MFIKPSISINSALIGGIETPIITVEDIPANIEVGSKVKPKVTVLRADGITPIENAKADFFVIDSDGISPIGTQQLTDATGVTYSSEDYYISTAEAGTTIEFIIVVRRLFI